MQDMWQNAFQRWRQLGVTLTLTDTNIFGKRYINTVSLILSKYIIKKYSKQNFKNHVLERIKYSCKVINISLNKHCRTLLGVYVKCSYLHRKYVLLTLFSGTKISRYRPVKVHTIFNSGGTTKLSSLDAKYTISLSDTKNIIKKNYLLFNLIYISTY